MMNVFRGVNFFVSAQYLKNEMSDLNEIWYTHAWLVRGGSLLILRIVEQSSRSQLLKIKQKLDKNEMLDLNETWYTHA